MDACKRDGDKVFAYKCGHGNYLLFLFVLRLFYKLIYLVLRIRLLLRGNDLFYMHLLAKNYKITITKNNAVTVTVLIGIFYSRQYCTAARNNNCGAN